MAAETFPQSYDAQLFEFDSRHADRYAVTSFETLKQDQGVANFYQFEVAEPELTAAEAEVRDRLSIKVGQAAVNGVDGTLAEVFYGLGARHTRVAPHVGQYALAA